MTVQNFSLANLKKVKNTVIGNPLAKLQLARDELFVRTLIECLNTPSPANPLLDSQGSASSEAIRIEAAHVIASLSYGSEEALITLLRCDAPRAFLYAISDFHPSDSIALRAAFARALRALTVSISDIVGPSQWGLRPDKSVVRNEAREALHHLFHLDSLDIYLPLLVDTSPQTSTYIAQLLASAVRSPEDRKIIGEWLPPSERLKEVKTKRGWEKTSAINLNAPSRQGGWVARNLTALLRSRDSKLQEAALFALASLSKENLVVACVLAKSTPDRELPPTLSSVLSLTKSRLIDVQLAACLCATHILRASSSNHSSPMDDTCIRTVLNFVNRMISTPSETTQNRTRACFILYYLVTDDSALCLKSFERGCLEKLAGLVRSITPIDAGSNWDEDEPESVSCLREAALTAIAALSLFDQDIRRSLTDDLRLLPYISASLAHRHVGVRYAACQCVRALSRAVAVTRTNIVDSGLGMAVFNIFKNQDEDRRVVNASLSAVANIVIDFSPLRPIYMEQKLMPRLVQILHSGDPALRVNAVWAIKNLLRKTTTETKRDVMSNLGWTHLIELLSDPDEAIAEQAFNVVRNLAENEDGIDMVFREVDPDVLLERMTVCMLSSGEDVVMQVVSALSNLTNGNETQQNLILSRPKLLENLRACLAESNIHIRRPAVCCVLQLAMTNPKQRKAFVDAGIVSTLRHMCEWSGAGVASIGTGALGLSMSPGAVSGRSSGGGVYGSWGGSSSGMQVGHHGYPHHPSMDEDKQVLNQAKLALEWLERGDTYVT